MLLCTGQYMPSEFHLTITIVYPLHNFKIKSKPYMYGPQVNRSFPRIIQEIFKYTYQLFSWRCSERSHCSSQHNSQLMSMQKSLQNVQMQVTLSGILQRSHDTAMRGGWEPLYKMADHWRYLLQLLLFQDKKSQNRETMRLNRPQDLIPQQLREMDCTRNCCLK